MMPIGNVLANYASDEKVLTAELLQRDEQVKLLRAEMLRIHGCLETCWARARAAQPANLRQTVLTVGGK